MADKQSTRIAYGEALKELGGEKKNVLVCDADLAHATMTANFAGSYPDRFYNFGIAEAEMVAAASALAHCGYTVFASTFAVFGAGRAFEQVRNAVCYTKANVKLACSHAGPSCGEDGGSHQAVEDISLMRTLPNMTVVVPADAEEMKKAVRAVAELDGPVYLRTGRLPTDVITTADTPFELGKAVQLMDGSDVAIIACGIMVPQAVYAAQALAKEGVSARVIDMHTIKPLDREAVLDAARTCGAVVTAEEHSIIGGLGSAVAEVLAENAAGVPFERVGIKDRFGQSGKPPMLFEEYGLTDKAICEAVRRVLAAK
ncbi:MAG: transketolase C-terminal domain-containing protein [bacterium]|nr:transketolase C-terminal domain-containing protein [bacterium]